MHNIAVVGGGFIGHVHADAILSSGAKLVSIVDENIEKTRVLHAEYGLVDAPLTFDDLLRNPQIDLISICTPNFLHFEMVLKVIEAGKHVICEKPLALSHEQSQILADAAAKKGVLTGVPFAYRFYPTVRDARGRISGGELGNINLLHGSYLQDWLLLDTDYNWRVDSKLGGKSRAFGDIGVHWCDLIEFISGERIAKVVAKSKTVTDRVDQSGKRVQVDSEDLVTLLFETANGVNGSAIISQVSAGRPNEIRINVDGSKSAIAFNQMLPESLWIGERGKNSIVWRGSSSSNQAAAKYWTVPAGHPQGYKDCFTALYKDMIARINGESIDGFPTFEDGVRAALITEKVLESIKSNQWVVI